MCARVCQGLWVRSASESVSTEKGRDIVLKTAGQSLQCSPVQFWRTYFVKPRTLLLLGEVLGTVLFNSEFKDAGEFFFLGKRWNKPGGVWMLTCRSCFIWKFLEVKSCNKSLTFLKITGHITIIKTVFRNSICSSLLTLLNLLNSLLKIWNSWCHPHNIDHSYVPWVNWWFSSPMKFVSR